MRRLAVTAILALSLAAPASAEAQEGDVGLGIGLSTVLFGDLEDVFLPVVYVPIMVAEGIMFEPGIGIARASQTDDDSDTETSFTVLSAASTRTTRPRTCRSRGWPAASSSCAHTSASAARSASGG